MWVAVNRHPQKVSRAKVLQAFLDARLVRGRVESADVKVWRVSSALRAVSLT